MCFSRPKRINFFQKLAISILILCPAQITFGQASKDELANNTVLLVRHAEKPASGRELSTAGEARANAYTRYFVPFRELGRPLHVTALYAGADSDNSMRPRLTMEPLGRTTHMPLDTSVNTKDSAGMVHLLRLQAHGDTPLICWRHGAIPDLITAFGGDPKTVLPEGKWPDDVYDWVIVLKFDNKGALTSEQRLIEHLPVN